WNKFANDRCRHEVLCHVLLTLWRLSHKFPAHDAEQAFSVRIEDARSRVPSRCDIADQCRELVAKLEGEYLRRNNMRSRGTLSSDHDDRVSRPRGCFT